MPEIQSRTTAPRCFRDVEPSDNRTYDPGRAERRIAEAHTRYATHHANCQVCRRTNWYNPDEGLLCDIGHRLFRLWAREAVRVMIPRSTGREKSA